MKRFNPRVAVSALSLLLLASGRAVAAPKLDEMEVSLRQNYAEIVFAAYSDAQVAAKALSDEIMRFVDKPTDKGLKSCRAAWVKARQPYSKTEAFRFYGGPIDDASGGIEGQLNAWPVDESWMEDSTPGSKRGIIQDVEHFPKIDAKLLLERNQLEGEKNICTGWHAIEFLLWGVDNNPNGPGDRPLTDFTDGPLASRRCDVLRGDAINLMSCLDKLVAAWDPASPDNYRAQFIKTDAKETSRRIFTGITLLVGGEMAGERLTVCLETRDQENEQSCFSDTTKQDVIHNLLGAKMVWEGKFSSKFLAETEFSGAGLRDLVKSSWDPAMAGVIDDAFAKAEKTAMELPELIDHAIGSPDDSPERMAVVKARDSLEYLHAMFVALTGRLGLVLPSTPLDG